MIQKELGLKPASLRMNEMFYFLWLCIMFMLNFISCNTELLQKNGRTLYSLLKTKIYRIGCTLSILYLLDKYGKFQIIYCTGQIIS